MATGFHPLFDFIILLAGRAFLMSSLRFESRTFLRETTGCGGIVARDAFLISRLVVLGTGLRVSSFLSSLVAQGVLARVALLTNFALLALIFASWNVEATLSVKGTGELFCLFLVNGRAGVDHRDNT